MPLGILGALVIGVSLGLLGSGGSILTVPILVYLLGQPEKVAIAGSLAIVGAISLVGTVPYALKRQVDGRSVVLFGVPGMAGSFLGAYLAHWVSGPLQLLLFAVIMILAAVFMLRSGPTTQTRPERRHAAWKIAVEGLAVGIVTGLVGVGGGFLIVPALAMLGGLPMHVAIGTSLLIIALKSLVGFLEYLQVLGAIGLHLDWGVIAIFIGVGAVGSVLGGRLAKRVSQATLKRTFGAFLVAMGAFILWQNVPDVLDARGRAAAAAHAPPALVSESRTDGSR